jgi:dTDP-4-dehydrorhamnose 3,5-epimerase-like enzyme
MYNDPALHIDWKLQAHEMILSEKDKKNPLLSACQNLFEY